MSPEAADVVFAWGNRLLIASLAIGVVSTYAVVVSGVVRDRGSAAKIAEAKAQAAVANEAAATANEAVERAKAEIAKANAMAAQAEARAAGANERAAKLEKEAAEARLELERLKSTAAVVDHSLFGGL